MDNFLSEVLMFNSHSSSSQKLGESKSCDNRAWKRTLLSGIHVFFSSTSPGSQIVRLAFAPAMRGRARLTSGMTNWGSFVGSLLLLMTLMIPAKAMQFREDTCIGKDNEKWSLEKRHIQSEKKVQENPLFGASVSILSNGIYYNGVMITPYHGITCAHFEDKKGMVVTGEDFFCPLLALKKKENFITLYEPHPYYCESEVNNDLISAQEMINELKDPDQALDNKKGKYDVALFKTEKPIFIKKYPEIYFDTKNYKQAFQKTNCYVVGVTTEDDTSQGIKVPMSTKRVGFSRLSYNEKNNLFYSQHESRAGDIKSPFKVSSEMHQLQIRFQPGLSGSPILCKPQGQDVQVLAIATSSAFFREPQLLYERGKKLKKEVPYYQTYDISTPLGGHKEWILDFLKK